MLPPRNGSFPSFGGVVKQVRLRLCTDGMGPSCRAASVLEPVVSQLRIPTGVEWTDLPMLGLSPGPLYTGHQMALIEDGTPRPDRQSDRQRSAMPR